MSKREKHYMMTHEHMQRLLTHRFKRRRNPVSRYNGGKPSGVLVMCSAGCGFPIVLGDRVITKGKSVGNTAVYHRKCLEASYY